MTRSRIILLVDNVHMGLGHDGLTLLAAKLRVDVRKLERNHLVMFMNRAKDKLKVLGGGGLVIAYLKMPNHRRIMLDAVQYLPQIFDTTGKIDYDQALEKVLKDKLARNSAVNKPVPHTLYRAR